MQNQIFFKTKNPSEKKFGLFFALIFFLISIYLFYINNNYYSFTLLVGFAFFVTSLFFNSLLKVPNMLWMKLGFVLNIIVSPVIMFLIFLFTFFPIGIFLKILRIDIIGLKYNKSLDSYWIERKEDIQSLRKLY